MARRTETAFGDPEAARTYAEMALMGRNRELDLRVAAMLGLDERLTLEDPGGWP